MSTNEDRGRLPAEHKLEKEQLEDLAKTLHDKGYSNAAIAHILRIPESMVRTTLEEPTRGMPRSQIVEIIKRRNLSNDEAFKVDGPWGHEDLERFEAPIYIFVPGGARREVGKVVVTNNPGMKFDVQLDEEYKGIETAGFDLPMRFRLFRNNEGQGE